MRAFNFFCPAIQIGFYSGATSPWKRRLKMQQTPLAVPFLVPTRAHSELFVALMGLSPPFPCSLSLERLHDDGFSSKNGTPLAFLSVVQRPPCASTSRSIDPAINISRGINVKCRAAHKQPDKLFAEIVYPHRISLFIRRTIYLDSFKSCFARVVLSLRKRKKLGVSEFRLNSLDRNIVFNDRIRKYALLRLTQFPPSRSFQFSRSFVAIVCRGEI